MTEAASPKTGIERRRTERIPMPATGGVVSVVGGRLVNVSSYGMMIESPMALETDTILQFRLVIAGDKVDVEARVACCAGLRDTGRKGYGVGLEFVRIPPEAQAKLTDILRAHAPGYHH